MEVRSVFGSNLANTNSARTSEPSVARIAPQRKTARFSRGTAISINAIKIGQPKMYVNGDMLKQEKGQHHEQAECQQEGIGLEGARLHEAKETTGEIHRAAGAAHAEAGDDPAVEPIGIV